MKRVVIVIMMGLMGACSAGGSGATVGGGSGATLSETKSTLDVPSGSFTDTLTVTLSENQADTKAIGPVRLISNPVTLEFSKAAIVENGEPLQLVIQLNREEMQKSINEGKGIYAKMRLKGEQISDDREAGVEDLWFPILGELNVDNATLKLDFYAGAQEIEVAAVAGDELKIVIMDPAGSHSGKSTKKKSVSTVDMGQNPWAVVCNTSLLSDQGLRTCDATNLNSMVAQVQNGLTDAARDLATRLHMQKMVIQQLTALSLAQTNLSTLPDPAVLRRHDPSVKYNMAYLNNGAACAITNNRSCHFSATGLLIIAEANVNEVYTQAAGNVFHHELTHAVQAAYMPRSASIDPSVNINRNVAIIEGTAQAVGLLAAGNWNTQLTKGKPSAGAGLGRNWADPLGKYNPHVDSYRMTEFFSLADNGKLEYLAPLFNAFNAAGGSFHPRLGSAINVALNDNLQNVFLKRVMAQRGYNSPSQRNYEPIDVTDNDVEHSYDRSVKSMSAHQFLFQDKSRGDICISVNLFRGADPDLALVMLNGTEGGDAMPYGDDNVARMSTNGDVLTVNGHEADVQVVNLNTGQISDSKDYTISAFTHGACLPPAPEQPCNKMRVSCGSQGCGLYVEAIGGRCWAKAIDCDGHGRCTRPGFEGGFDFGSCENLKNQMTQNIPAGDDRRSDPADVPENRRCGDVDLGCRWIVLCPR